MKVMVETSAHHVHVTKETLKLSLAKTQNSQTKKTFLSRDNLPVLKKLR